MLRAGPLRALVRSSSARYRRREVSRMNLRVVLEPSEDGGYTVTVPALPGSISEGDTRDKALANIQEAIRLYLEPVDDDAVASSSAEVVEVVV